MNNRATAVIGRDGSTLAIAAFIRGRAEMDSAVLAGQSIVVDCSTVPYLEIGLGNYLSYLMVLNLGRSLLMMPGGSSSALILACRV